MPVLPKDAIVQRSAKDRTVRTMKAKNLSEELEQSRNFRELQSKDSYAAIALAFISEYRSYFLLQEPVEELADSSVQTDELGYKHIKFRQVFHDLPVFSAEIIVHLDKGNHVYLIEGRYIPTPKDISVTPAIEREKACSIAEASVKNEIPESICRASQLGVYASHKGDIRLAYRLSIVSWLRGWEVTVDGKTGEILDKSPIDISGQ